jgi:hypothetical protein
VVRDNQLVERLSPPRPQRWASCPEVYKGHGKYGRSG